MEHIDPMRTSLELSKDYFNIINEPTPEDLITYREIGEGSEAAYVEVSEYIKKYNKCFGLLWDIEVLDQFRDQEQVVAKVRMTVRIPSIVYKKYDSKGTLVEEVQTKEVVMSKTDFGGCTIKRFRNSSASHKSGDMMDLANDYKSAVADGMKKCGSLIGFFSDVYSLPIRRTKGTNIASDTDYAIVYKRGSEAGMDEEQTRKWVLEVTGKQLEDLDKIQSNQLIPKLIHLKKTKETENV